MANGAADPQSANKELRRLLKSAIGKAKRAATDDREWWSTEIDTLCEKMAPLWRTCGIETPGIWTDGGNKLHPSPVPTIHLKTLDPDTRAERGTILRSGKGKDAFNAPARAVLELMDVAERWIEWLELRDAVAMPAPPDVPRHSQQPFDAASRDALRGDLETLRANFSRLFSMDVRAVVQTIREYWPSRYTDPKPGPLALDPPGDWRGCKFVGGQGLAFKARGPRTVDEANTAETFYGDDGKPLVDAVGKPLTAVQEWTEDNLLMCVGSGAERFIESFDLANRVASIHASVLAPILFDEPERVSFCAYSWPSIVNRVAELAGRTTLRPPVWKVSNGQTSWTVKAWRQRDKVALSRPIYSPADVELIGDEPEGVYADRESFIHDSELALDWLLEKLQEPATASYAAKLPPELDAVLSLRQRQVSYALNPDLPWDALEGTENKVRAELATAGIEYEGNPVEWLRTTAGGRYVERKFNGLLDASKAGAGNLTPQEIEAIAERTAERIAAVHRGHTPHQMNLEPLATGRNAAGPKAQLAANPPSVRKADLQASLTRCIEAADWFLALPPQSHVSNTGQVPFYSPLLAVFHASDGAELIGRELVPIPPPFAQVCEALLATPQAALGIELKRRARELEQSLLNWRDACHLIVEQWRWDNDCIGELPDDLYVIFGAPPAEMVDSLEAIRSDARALLRLLKACESLDTFCPPTELGACRQPGIETRVERRRSPAEQNQPGEVMGVATFDAALFFEDGDRVAAVQTNKRWCDSKRPMPPIIGKCPRDGRRKLSELSEVVKFVDQFYNLGAEEKKRLRDYLSTRRRKPV